MTQRDGPFVSFPFRRTRIPGGIGTQQATQKDRPSVHLYALDFRLWQKINNNPYL